MNHEAKSLEQFLWPELNREAFGQKKALYRKPQLWATERSRAGCSFRRPCRKKMTTGTPSHRKHRRVNDAVQDISKGLAAYRDHARMQWCRTVVVITKSSLSRKHRHQSRFMFGLTLPTALVASGVAIKQNSTTKYAHQNIGTISGRNQFTHERFKVILQIRMSMQNGSRSAAASSASHK